MNFPSSAAPPATRPQAAPERAVNDPMVTFEGVTKTFGGADGKPGFAALAGVDYVVPKGSITGIIGRSGAGKSTLIRLANGLEKPSSGRVVVDGVDVAALDEKSLRTLRRSVGMIFQHFNLLSSRTAFDNVALPLEIAGLGKKEIETRVAPLLDLVGLSDKARRYPAELSGGQKQRVGIARALAAGPALLLSDEATSALDPETTRSILALLKDINQRFGLTILLITHEMEVIRSIADRVAVIDAGRIVEEGPVWSVFADPQSAITQSLLGGIRPQLPADIAEKLSSVPGREAILRVDVAGDAARRPLLAELATAVPGRFRLIHGGVDHVQGEPVGSLFLGVVAKDGQVAKTLDFLTARNARAKVLGYV